MSQVVIPIAVLAVTGLGVLAVLRRTLVAVQINGSSMEPTYRSGDRVLVRRRRDRVRVGEVVVMERPGASGGWPMPPPDGGDLHRREWIIKRVAAVAGDPVPPEVVPALPAGSGPAVPAGMVVVLGDAPGRSLDSRYIGFVPVGRILGTAVRRLPA